MSTIFMLFMLATPHQPQPHAKYRYMPPQPQIARGFGYGNPSQSGFAMYGLTTQPRMQMQFQPRGFSGWTTPSGYDPFANPYFQMATSFLVPTYPNYPNFGASQNFYFLFR